jgi:hypothetical protein
MDKRSHRSATDKTTEPKTRVPAKERTRLHRDKKKRRGAECLDRVPSTLEGGPGSASRSAMDADLHVWPLAMLALLQRLCCVALHCDFFERKVPAVLLSLVYQVTRSRVFLSQPIASLLLAY